MACRATVLSLVVLRVAAGSDTATVTLSSQVVQKQPISENFVGFSIEVAGALKQLSLNGEARPSYSNLMKHLRGSSGRGPNIRVGGNSADESVFLPAPAPLPAGDTYRITGADLDSYAKAIPSWNGTLTLDVNFRDGASAALAVAHVRAAAAAMPWSLIESIEVGNEVDLFYENGIRNASYDYAQYEAEFDLYQKAIQNSAGAPYPRIQGAVYCCSRKDFDSSLKGYVQKYTKGGSGGNALSSISYHHYPLDVTISQLMADSAATSSTFPGYVADVTPSGIPLYVGEGNSVACGGEAGVSDAFAAALWVIDALFHFASYGVSRWNFHGCPEGPYCAIVYTNTSVDEPAVMPLYYGLWAFVTASTQRSVIYAANVQTTNPFIKAWHVRDATGAERVVLLHKDPANNAVPPSSADVTVIPTAPQQKPATAVTLSSGPQGLASKTGLDFGGLTFDGTQDGNPAGRWAPVDVPFDAQARGFKLSLKQGSAVILSLP